MPLSRADLFDRLDRLGIATVTVEHPPLFTVEEARRLRGAIPGTHTKNLFVKDRRDRVFVVVAEEDQGVDLKRLHETIGADGRLSFGRPDLLAALLGVTPGSVTPFAAINDETGAVTIVLDEALLAHETLNFHPLDNRATTAIAPRDLVGFLRAVAHEPLFVALPAPAERGSRLLSHTNAPISACQPTGSACPRSPD